MENQRKLPRSAAWTTALVLGLLLTGCTTPTGEPPPLLEGGSPEPPAADGGEPFQASRASSGPSGQAHAEDPLVERVQRCLKPNQRSQEFHPEEVLLRVTGCLLARVQALDTGAGSAVNETFDVAPGAEHLRVLFHLHGPERVRVWLTDPAGTVREFTSVGGSGRDSLVIFEAGQPLIGTWRVEAVAEATVVAREWSLVSVTRYGE